MPVQYKQQNQRNTFDEAESTIKFDYESAEKKRKAKKNRSKNLLIMLAVCAAAVGLGNVAHTTVFTDSKKDSDTLTDADYLSNNNQSYALIQEGYSIDGVHYDIDATVQDFLDKGWSLSFDEGDSAVEVLEPNAYISFSLYKSDASISARVSNYSDESVDLKSQPLRSLLITDTSGRVVLPYGLKHGMDAAEAEDILSERNLPWHSERNYRLVYNVDIETRREEETEHWSSTKYGYNDLNIYFDEEDKISSISWYVYDNDIDASISVFD